MKPSTLALALVIAAPLAAQEPGRVAAAYAKFRSWSVLRQLAVLAPFERAHGAPSERAPFDPFAGRPFDVDSLPVAKKPRFLDPKEWGEDGAPARRLVKDGSESWRQQRQTMPTLNLLPGLALGVWYDWGDGKIVRRARPLSPEERAANLLRGFAPDSDVRIARIEQALDDDPRMRKLARYFDHSYADLQANVYDGVTLYDAWASGAQLAMPDIEVIAFAKWLLDDDSLHAPIPGDQSAPVFTEMGKAAVEYRKYRTLREVMAGALLCKEPTRDQRYAALAARCHWIWASFSGNLVLVREALAALPDRDDVVAGVDAEVQRDPKQAELRDEFGATVEKARQAVVDEFLKAIESAR